MYRNEKVNVPILGLVENMAWFTPAELPNNRYYIFGREGATRLAEELGVPVLAQIPIVQSICDGGDSGEPVALRPETIQDRPSPISQVPWQKPPNAAIVNSIPPKSSRSR